MNLRKIPQHTWCYSTRKTKKLTFLLLKNAHIKAEKEKYSVRKKIRFTWLMLSTLFVFEKKIVSGAERCAFCMLKRRFFRYLSVYMNWQIKNVPEFCFYAPSFWFCPTQSKLFLEFVIIIVIEGSWIFNFFLMKTFYLIIHDIAVGFIWNT
jgi:hypothetical protein